MLGQNENIQIIKKLIAEDKLPKFLLIVGDKGQGKKKLAYEIALMTNGYDKYHPKALKVDDIREIIEDSQTLHKRKIYFLFDAQDMTIQAQNALLKLAEEPPEKAYIVMTATRPDSVLETIRSRASIMYMQPYTKEELKHFTDDPELLEICTNPGQIKRYQSFDYKKLIELCYKVVDNIGRISLTNTFNILRHVDEENYDLVIPTLIYVYWRKLRAGNVPLRQLEILHETQRQIKYVNGINVRNALEMLFAKLWMVS
jgi:replication-associated recombination protein RarA